MAFESDGKLYECCACNDKFKYFKAMRTSMEKFTWRDENGDLFRPSLCCLCERKERVMEYRDWTNEVKLEKPTNVVTFSR